MDTDPRAEHWPNREVRHASYLAVMPLTDPAILIAHYASNNFVSQTKSTDKHTALHAQDMLRHLAEHRRPDSPG